MCGHFVESFAIAFRKPPMTDTLAAAKAIVTARRNRAPLRPLDPDAAPRDEAEGYRIQRAAHDLLLPYVGALVGYKIGCTSAVISNISTFRTPVAAACSPKAFTETARR
jgi:2-keto-4-pentenoate hydratase